MNGYREGFNVPGTPTFTKIEIVGCVKSVRKQLSYVLT